jgi:hypothetical protein
VSLHHHIREDKFCPNAWKFSLLTPVCTAGCKHCSHTSSSCILRERVRGCADLQEGQDGCQALLHNQLRRKFQRAVPQVQGLQCGHMPCREQRSVSIACFSTHWMAGEMKATILMFINNSGQGLR